MIPNVFITFSCVIEDFICTQENVINTIGITLSMGCICPNGTRTLYQNIWNDVTLNFKVNGEGHTFNNADFRVY